MKKVKINTETTRSIIAELKETLNPGTCRCFIDAFLTHKENLEVRNFHSETQKKHFFKRQNHSFLFPFVPCAFDSDTSSVFQDINNHYYHEDNLLHSTMNLFAAGTDTTADTLQWGLLYITKYPLIQGAETHRVDFSRSNLARLPRFSARPIRSGPGGAQQGGGKPPGTGRRQERPAVR